MKANVVIDDLTDVHSLMNSSCSLRASISHPPQVSRKGVDGTYHDGVLTFFVVYQA
jgi:hypothetical protein